MILLRYISSPTSRGATFKYKTVEKARLKAHQLVTATPKRDPDGYAVHPTLGNCLFLVEGVTFEELFGAWSEPKYQLSVAQKAFLAALDRTTGRWTEVLTEEHRMAASLERQGRIILQRNDQHWEARLP